MPSRGILDRLHFYAYIIVMKGEIGYMNTYGYVRVSSREQNENRQLIALKEVGLTGKMIFLDKQSGKDFNRPQYKKLLRKLKKGE